MAGTYRLTQKLMTLDSNQDLRGSEPRVLPVTPIIIVVVIPRATRV